MTPGCHNSSLIYNPASIYLDSELGRFSLEWEAHCPAGGGGVFCSQSVTGTGIRHAGKAGQRANRHADNSYRKALIMNERIGFGQRLLAAIIDGIVIGIGGGILGSVLGGMLGAGTGAAISAGETGQDAAANAAAATAAGGMLGALAGAAIGIGLMSLGWIIWEGLTGQALGKMLLKIRIKKEDGTDAGKDKLLTRAAVKYSNSLLSLIGSLTGIAAITKVGSLAGLVIFVGCFFVLGQKRQAIHDLIAKTAVFKA
jgi:uncharacterized RDD family membrane protein YckC